MTEKKDRDKENAPPTKRVHRPGVVYNPKPPHVKTPTQPLPDPPRRSKG
jgi:hypothetical protein